MLIANNQIPLCSCFQAWKKSNCKILLINSATGVKHQVYFSFDQFFTEKGFTVITYDYRRIGLSKPEKMKGFSASMRTWETFQAWRNVLFKTSQIIKNSV